MVSFCARALWGFGLILCFSGCGNDNGPKKIKLAFLTNNPSHFWTIAQRGCEKAEKELGNVEVDFRIPDDGTASTQRKMLDDLLARGVDGIAISPVDPDNQTVMLNKVAGRTLLITHDSDAPKSKRACYIGTDNRAAGRKAGELIKEVLPTGGKIMIFVGMRDTQNSKERESGIREVLKGTKIEIIDVRTDNTDTVRAKSNVVDALTNYPDLRCLVGLWGYNGPAILNAVRENKKSGKVKIVCFDEDEETLAGVASGEIHGTIVQQPYEFGYQAIIKMAAYIGGDTSVFPANKVQVIQTLVIRKDNVAEFQQRIKVLIGK